MTFQYNLVLIASIVFIDLTFSGDNIVAISAAALLVPPSKRWLVLPLGVIGAVILRLLLAQAVVFLLAIPVLSFIGGLLVFFMAVRLIIEKDQGHKESPSLREISVLSITEARGSKKWVVLGRQLALSLKQRSVGSPLSTQRTLLLAIATIVLADATTSLDNIIAIGAVGATARASLLLLAIGLIFSKVVLYSGSALIAKLLEHNQWLVRIASFLLVTIAVELIDATIHFGQWFVYGFYILFYGLYGLVVLVCKSAKVTD